MDVPGIRILFKHLKENDSNWFSRNKFRKILFYWGQFHRRLPKIFKDNLQSHPIHVIFLDLSLKNWSWKFYFSRTSTFWDIRDNPNFTPERVFENSRFWRDSVVTSHGQQRHFECIESRRETLALHCRYNDKRMLHRIFQRWIFTKDCIVFV